MRRHAATPKEPILLGIDLGTSRLKLAAVAPTGRVVATASASYTTDRSPSGHAEQDPDDWWAGFRDALVGLGRSMRRGDLEGIGAIGVAGQMHGLVAVNSRGRHVRPCMTWEDSRATAELDEVRGRISAERAAVLSGSPLAAGFAAGLARWLVRHEPASAQRSRWLLQPKDWLRFQLTGEAATEPSDASGTLLFDVIAGAWSSELLEAFEVDSGLLPPIVPSASVAGRLLRSVAAELGLPPGLPVVAGGGDSPAAALGAGIRVGHPGNRGLLSFGTAAQIAIPTDQPVPDPLCAFQLFRHVIDQQWLMVAAIPSAGSSIAWLAQLLLPKLDVASAIGQLLAEAVNVPPGARGVTFIPQLLGRRSPRADPGAAGAFVGLRAQHGRPELARAVLEGVGFALRDGLDALSDHESRPNTLRMVGGAGESVVWPRVLSAILDVRIEQLSRVAGAALGAAALAAEGAGIARAASLTGTPTGTIVERSEADVASFRAIHESGWAHAIAALG